MPNLRNLTVLAWFLLTGTMFAVSADVYTPLWLYDGSWQVTRKDQAPGAAPDKLSNQCSVVGRFFACEQTINGVHGALLIFIPAGKPGRYYTQNVNPDGRASGRGDLAIDGEQWIYTSTWNTGGQTVYYRTTNTLNGRNRIHFEQAESPDNKTWQVKNSGDEIRTGGTGLKH
jgi:hypothetical protein